jgi:hypothetical protein
MMNVIISKLLSVLGWQRLLQMVWNAIQDDLKRAAEKTETKIDDNLVVFMDEVIMVIVSDDKAA